MKIHAEEEWRENPDQTLRIGRPSWNETSTTDWSIKLTSRNCNGHVNRHGEIPVNALPQMLEFAIKTNALKLNK